jgi:hypothetical protein
MGLKFNREDVKLGAIPVGSYVASTSTTPTPLNLPNRAVDWEVLPSGAATQILTVNADGSIGWAAPASQNVMTTAGDTIYGGASGAATRLAVGTAGQVLTVNAGATAPSWTTVAVPGTLPVTLGSNHMTWGSAAPTTGTWAVGDVCWNTGAAAGGSPGWVNTSASGSGTWKAMANLAS